MVLVRSDDPDIQLQGLRTALSLSLGDRQADVLVARPGLGALGPRPGSEAEHCLQTLRQAGLGIDLDEAGERSPEYCGPEVLPHSEFVRRLATAEFVQVF